MRFLVFAGEKYYSFGGWEDWDSAYDSLDDAERVAREASDRRHHWAQVVDLESPGLVIRRFCEGIEQ